MNLNGTAAIVSGGASGLGEATVRDLSSAGCKVVVADLNEQRGTELAKEVGGEFVKTDVADEQSVAAAVATAESLGAPLRVIVSCAGIGWASRTVGRDGTPHDLGAFSKVIDVNLIGTFNLMRIGAAAVAKTEPADADGLRGVVINMVVIGVMAGIAVTLLGLPSPVLLGIFAGILEAIPIFGPFIGAAPAVLLGFTVGPLYALLVAGVFLVIQQVESNTLVPVVMNRVVALPPLAVVLALLVGGALQGVAGALLAVPVAAALQVLIVRVVVPTIHRVQGRTEQADREMRVREVAARSSQPLWKRLRVLPRRR